jgi:hypothetical protein
LLSAHFSDILPPDSLSTPKLLPAKTFEDLLKRPAIDNLEAVAGNFPAKFQEAVKGNTDMEKKKDLIKEALEKIKTNRENRDPLTKVSAEAKEADKSADNLEAPPAVKKVPPKKDNSHVNLLPPIDIIQPTIGSEQKCTYFLFKSFIVFGSTVYCM